MTYQKEQDKTDKVSCDEIIKDLSAKLKESKRREDISERISYIRDKRIRLFANMGEISPSVFAAIMDTSAAGDNIDFIKLHQERFNKQVYEMADENRRLRVQFGIDKIHIKMLTEQRNKIAEDNDFSYEDSIKLLDLEIAEALKAYEEGK